MPAEDILEQALLPVLEGFGGHYAIKHHVAVDGMPARAMAELHSEHERGLLGLPSSRLGLGVTVAHEYALFVLDSQFGAAQAGRAIALCEAATRTLLQLDEQHAYTFFSVVSLTGGIDQEGVRLVKRYKQRATYQHGWSMARLAAVDVRTKELLYNRDGKDLAQLVRAHLKQAEQGG